MERSTTKISNYGSEHPIVARLSIQAKQLVGVFFLPREKADAIISLFLFDIQPRLLKCWEHMMKIETEYMRCQSIPENELSKNQVFNCPTIINLNLIVEDFLEECKAVLREIIQLLNIFYSKDFHDSKYNDAYAWAKNEFNDYDNLTMFLKYHHDKWILRIQNMRDTFFHRYSTKNKPIIIENIRINKVSGHLQISAPIWYSEDEPPSYLIDDMKDIINNLLCFCEELLVLLLKKTSTDIYVKIEEIKEPDRETSCPLRFKPIYERFPTENEMKTISENSHSG